MTYGIFSLLRVNSCPSYQNVYCGGGRGGEATGLSCSVLSDGFLNLEAEQVRTYINRRYYRHHRHLWYVHGRSSMHTRALWGMCVYGRHCSDTDRARYLNKKTDNGRNFKIFMRCVPLLGPPSYNWFSLSTRLLCSTVKRFSLFHRSVFVRIHERTSHSFQHFLLTIFFSIFCRIRFHSPFFLTEHLILQHKENNYHIGETLVTRIGILRYCLHAGKYFKKIIGFK